MRGGLYGTGILRVPAEPPHYVKNMREISSKENATLKTVVSLSQKKNRDALGMYILEGPNPLREALEQGVRLRYLFIEAASFEGEAEEIAALAEEKSVAPYILANDCFRLVSDTVNSQGIVGVALKREYSPEELFFPGSNILVIDRVQDPGNIGTMLRAAEGCGMAGVLIVKGSSDPYGPKAVRASAGSILRMPLLFCEDASEALQLLEATGKSVWCADMEGRPCYEADIARDAAFVIGNEGGGADEIFLKGAQRISVPMAGRAESLNAALAAAIIMYESLRQRAIEI